MYYRNEWKYLVTGGELAVLGARLKVLLPLDKHQTGAVYAIRSRTSMIFRTVACGRTRPAWTTGASFGCGCTMQIPAAFSWK